MRVLARRKFWPSDPVVGRPLYLQSICSPGLKSGFESKDRVLMKRLCLKFVVIVRFKCVQYLFLYRKHHLLENTPWIKQIWWIWWKIITFMINIKICVKFSCNHRIHSPVDARVIALISQMCRLVITTLQQINLIFSYFCKTDLILIIFLLLFQHVNSCPLMAHFLVNFVLFWCKVAPMWLQYKKKNSSVKIKYLEPLFFNTSCYSFFLV